MKKIALGLIVLSIVLLSSCEKEITDDGNVAEKNVQETIQIEEKTGTEIRKDYDKKGNYYIQYVSGNIVEGKQWKYDFKNNLMRLDDEIANFYDLESKTEVGELAYFFRAEKEGDEIVTWTLYDVKTNEVYYTAEIEFKIDAKKDKDGHNTFTLISSREIDNRLSDMSAYKFDEPEITEHGEGNGG